MTFHFADQASHLEDFIQDFLQTFFSSSTSSNLPADLETSMRAAAEDSTDVDVQNPLEALIDSTSFDVLSPDLPLGSLSEASSIDRMSIDELKAWLNESKVTHQVSQSECSEQCQVQSADKEKKIPEPIEGLKSSRVVVRRKPLYTMKDICPEVKVADQSINRRNQRQQVNHNDDFLLLIDSSSPPLSVEPTLELNIKRRSEDQKQRSARFAANSSRTF